MDNDHPHEAFESVASLRFVGCCRPGEARSLEWAESAQNPEFQTSFPTAFARVGLRSFNPAASLTIDPYCLSMSS